jgi:hypothetical protein
LKGLEIGFVKAQYPTFHCRQCLNCAKYLQSIADSNEQTKPGIGAINAYFSASIAEGILFPWIYSLILNSGGHALSIMVEEPHPFPDQSQKSKNTCVSYVCCKLETLP